MGKEMLDDLEKVQEADDSWRRGYISRKEYKAVQDKVIRNSGGPKKPVKR